MNMRDIHRMFLTYIHRTQESWNTKHLRLLSSVTKLFYYLWVKKIFNIRRETQSFYAGFFYLPSPQHQHVQQSPQGHGVQAKVNRLLPKQNSNHWLFQNPPHALPVHDVIHIQWSIFLSGIFILTSVNVTSSRTRVNTCAQVCT